ncbi:Rhodanese domain protein [Planctopirus limnophila DSM 3776]|uniref:Rhodanese domain protein n=1 Tax=Planctopirus limnophila (strain ATCC 43296 / DSM 3776 / IFAM 1008 / Mu 290) TaxID=521674 RepID=D5SYK1_PLAL2|nr:rhodanese-like domain-containing protein [Planctopirus limnophila]ADG67729.1 Rhodanese domain protein [Planctopirus limnophila DSM 3776]
MNLVVRNSLVIVALVFAGFGHAQGADYTTDSLDVVKQQVQEKKALLVDVRDQAEWDRGHVEGALLVPFRKLQKGMTQADVEKILPKNQIIYTHCAVGARSLGAAGVLKDYGYDVRPLQKGYKDLVKEGFPVAK